MHAIELLAENRGDYPGYLRGEAAVQMARVKAVMLLPLFNLKFYGEIQEKGGCSFVGGQLLWRVGESISVK